MHELQRMLPRHYAIVTLALAGTENLQSTNPWLPLCPTTSCFNSKYYVDSSQCSVP